MMQRIKRLVGHWPFTTFGVFTFAVLVLSAYGVVPADGLWRALIVVPYVIHLLIVMLAVFIFGPQEPESSWLLTTFFVVTLPLRFLPFLLADRLLMRFSHRVRDRKPAGA